MTQAKTSYLTDKKIGPGLTGVLVTASAAFLMSVAQPAIAEQKMDMGSESKMMMTTMMQDQATDKDVKEAVMMLADDINVPGAYLKNAQFPGPFTAGVNQVIPFENFGGDGMLTRLLLKSAKGAAWSDNGSAKHEALAPVAHLAKGMYFYQVKLTGETGKLQDMALLDKLKMNGMKTYKAMVLVYGAKDGKADMANQVASKDVMITLNHDTTDQEVKEGVKTMVANKSEVPVKYLKKAKYPGPFTAGVNQIIPLESFGGDGMLTRLLLTSSKGAAWSDNGKAKHKALLPVKELEKGRYFYQVQLAGKEGKLQKKALLKKLKANGKHSYKATVKVYGAKDGKADKNQVIDEKMITFMVK
ncbi:SSURE domain-containing protein [Streptococcus halichoeri]|uniref:SSURE domain-containing protein n=1 Tax=Streptococcus halichoeri TaxID=254785 RepID=UPI0013593A91|nr:fibronectin-binding SSURE repeat-containing protein [Streptococcus halichoeri]